MFAKCIYTAFLLLTFATAFAQPPAMGLEFNHPAYAAAPALPNYGKGSQFGTMPFSVDLRQYAPYCGHQGDIASCTAWATAYSAYSIERAIRAGNTLRDAITRDAYSAMYVYHHIKVDECTGGAYLTETMKFLESKGDWYSRAFESDNCGDRPSVHFAQQAMNHRTEGYATIFPYGEAADQKIHRTKLMLSNNKPVVIGMALRANFVDIAAGEAYWNPEAGDTRYAGGHAMTVVGYDDRRQAFLLMNSWGRDWGIDGFIWVRYADYGKYCKYGYVLFVGNPGNDVSPDVPASLSGTFGFRYMEPAAGDLTFQNAQPRWNGNYYELVRQDWTLSDRFQLIAMNTRPDEYVSVFSLDPNGETNIHWPKQQNLSVYFDGMNEVSINPIAGTEIVIPGEESAFALEERGDDYLCVLFSSQPISDFKEVVAAVQNGSGSFNTRLQQALGRRLIPTSQINYDVTTGTNRQPLMSFSAESSQGHIVPLVLKVTMQ